MNQRARRVGYVFLCVLPFLSFVVAAARPLRVSGVYQTVGLAMLTAIAISVWIVGREVMRVKESGPRQMALAGFLLILPWAIISLLWVGIGPPFQATLPENYMRFVVLLWDSIFVSIAFVVLTGALHKAGERFYSSVGFGAALSAGAAYLGCLSFSLAQVATLMRGDKTPLPMFLDNFYSVLEFVACVTTYVATLFFAAALWRTKLLRPGAACVYMAVSAIMMLLIIARGIDFPEISSHTAPWYTRPGVIAGIPAIPWLMPCLLGVVLLRRAGDVQLSVTSES
jgi:hypothetical protein